MASTDTTSPTSSTMKANSSPSCCTTTFMISASASRAGSCSVTRRSTAVTIWPRRLRNPAMASGAIGTRAMRMATSTSCTTITGMPSH
jgi:hypothetical protein